MSTLFADRVAETSQSTGTGNFTLNGAIPGYQSFATAFGTNNAYYCIVNRTVPSEWEIGTFSVNGTTMARVAGNVLSGSAGAGTLVSFSAGLKDIHNIIPAAKLSAAKVTSVTAGTGLSGGTITTTGTVAMATTGVSAASYGSTTTNPVYTVNNLGLITSASNATRTTTAVTAVGVSGALGNASYSLGASVSGNSLTISLNCNCNCCCNCACCCNCCCGGGGDDGA